MGEDNIARDKTAAAVALPKRALDGIVLKFADAVVLFEEVEIGQDDGRHHVGLLLRSEPDVGSVIDRVHIRIGEELLGASAPPCRLLFGELSELGGPTRDGRRLFRGGAVEVELGLEAELRPAAKAARSNHCCEWREGIYGGGRLRLVVHVERGLTEAATCWLVDEAKRLLGEGKIAARRLILLARVHHHRVLARVGTRKAPEARLGAAAAFTVSGHHNREIVLWHAPLDPLPLLRVD